jgi:hypothetical protein
MKDKLEVIISYQEAEWLGNSLWLKFVNQIKNLMPSFTDGKEELNPQKLVEEVSGTSFESIAS